MFPVIREIRLLESEKHTKSSTPFAIAASIAAFIANGSATNTEVTTCRDVEP